MIAQPHYEQRQLRDFLAGCSESDCSEIARHVEECLQCQKEIEAIAAGGFDWDEASELLRRDADDESSSNELMNGTRQLLESSDYPGSLGRFGRYEVMRCLGRGGMGIVFRVFDPELQRYSAVKILAPEFAGHAAARRRFSREAKTAAAVVHPHVVPIQTVDEHNGTPFLVMPVIEGQSLQQRVDQGGPVSIVESVRIAGQIAEGLAAAHGQGLVHRDIKPANILLENGVERVQITDFGLARAVDDVSMTRSGVIAGTPQYMSPEQAHGDDIDHRSDLFSLGSVMYFMLSGHSPFRANTTMGVLNRIGNDSPRPLRSVNPDVPDWLEAIVMKLLEKDREDRFENAEQTSEVLGQALVHLQSPADTAPPATGPRQRRIPRTGRWLATVVGLGLLIGLSGVVYLETQKGTIKIESNTDSDVPIVIRRGDRTVQHLTVSGDGATARLHAGEYVIEVSGDDAEFAIKGDRVILQRGGEWIAKIEPLSAGEDSAQRVRGETEAEPDMSDVVDVDDPAGSTRPSSQIPGEADDPVPSPEFVPVKVTIVGEGGGAIEGASVHVRMIGQGDRPVEVEDVSKKDGVAVDQLLPYGKFSVEVSTPDGWRLQGAFSAPNLKVVQFGKGLSLTVVAPSTDKQCVTTIETGPKDGFAEVSKLRFGQVREYQSLNSRSAYGTPYTPEPDAPLEEFESFPMPGDGIDEIAYSIQFHLTRKVVQPDKKTSEWTWAPNGQNHPVRFLASRRGLQRYKIAGSGSLRPTNEDGFFVEFESNRLTVGFVRFEELSIPLATPHQVVHPPGSLAVYLLDVYGHPITEAQAALGIEPRAKDTQPWLPLNLLHESTWTLESKWLPKLVETTDWSPQRQDGTHLGHLLRKDLSLKAGEESTIRVEAVFGNRD